MHLYGKETQTYTSKNEGIHSEITSSSNTILYTTESLTNKELIIDYIFVHNEPISSKR